MGKKGVKVFGANPLTTIAGILLGLGIFLCYSAVKNRQTLLEVRVFKYLPNKVAEESAGSSPLKLLRPLWENLGSTTDSVEQRLAILGNPQDLSAFRFLQLGLAVLATLISGTGLAVLSLYRPLNLLQWLIITSLTFIGTTLAWDKILTMRVNTFAKKLSYQVADAAELLALAVSAGESVPGAISRVAGITGTQMRLQLESALNQISQGMPVSKALRNLANSTPSPQLQRLLDTLVSGTERGAALSEILRHQARDLREEAMRTLLEAGGRKEIAMLMPVVFIILPVTVVFALYPGLIALKF